jgi:hypothetical protein
MMIYRCTACTRDHYSQPATCEGCGLASFAVIHLTMPELARALADTPPPLVEADDSPATPRDMPEPPERMPVSLDASDVPAIEEAAREAAERLANEGEEVTVAALRPVMAKARGVCSQTTCDAPATHRFTWPGHPEAVSCHEHALKAVMLAEHMGFFLEAPALKA